MFVDIKDRTLLQKIKKGDATVQEVANHLMANHTSLSIATALAEIIITEGNDDVPKPVVITMDQLKSFFKVQGWLLQENGCDVLFSKDPRGRGKKKGEF